MEEGGGGERGQIALRCSLVCVDNKLKCCFSLGDENCLFYRLLKFPPHVKTIRRFQREKVTANIFLLVSFFSPEAIIKPNEKPVVTAIGCDHCHCNTIDIVVKTQSNNY